MSGSIYIAWLIIDPSIEAKLRDKHDITGDEVREALQWPSIAESVWEDHPQHGRRVIAVGTAYDGRAVIAALLPQDETDGTWIVKTARWV